MLFQSRFHILFAESFRFDAADATVSFALTLVTPGQAADITPYCYQSHCHRLRLIADATCRRHEIEAGWLSRH